MTDAPIVVASEVNKTFPGGIKALIDFSLSVDQGEVVVVIGPSGSGKSTFLRCLNGLESIDSGRIVVDGMELNENRKNQLAIRTEVGMVFQSFNLFPHLTVLDNITLAPRLVRGKRGEEAEREALALLDKVGLTDKVRTYPNHLSGGQQQRVAIARALAMHPAVMLFDEATSALDPEVIGEVLAVMQGLAADGMTMIVVTHEMGFAREAGDRIVFMEDGRMVEQAATSEFFDNPRHERTKRFLDQIL